MLNQYRDRIAYDGHVSDFNFPALESDDGETISRHPQVFINHHYFPSVLPRERHIFVTTLYPLLYGIGFPVLRYLMRRFENRFSRLVGAIWKWARTAGEPAACDQDMLERFFKAHFGKGSHITGLVRYMLYAAELRRRAVNGQVPNRKREPDADGAMYKLSSRSAVLRRLPDCARILQHLIGGSDGPLDAALLYPRYDFLLLLPPDDTGVVTNFVINEPGAALLEYFLRPRVWPDNGDFQLQTGYPMPSREFIQDLVAQGVLEQTSHEPRQ